MRSRTLAIGWGERRFVTDAEGVATINYEPDSHWSGYSSFVLSMAQEP